MVGVVVVGRGAVVVVAVGVVVGVVVGAIVGGALVLVVVIRRAFGPMAC